jgi:nitronate monooxygenase
MSLKALLDGLAIPIVQAPMVGAQDERMAIAVSRAGAVGSLGSGAMAPADIEAAAAAIRGATEAPFLVNLQMAPALKPARAELEVAMARLAPWYERFGEPLPPTPNTFAQDFETQLDAVVRAAPPIASFIFGVLPRADVERLQASGSYVVGTANTVAEARAWTEAGADGVCAQGFEAGGHHGYFLGDIEASSVGTLALVATILAAVDVPVIAAGGIMGGRGIAAALALGASAVQMGSAFLLADEATTGPAWQAALKGAAEDTTRLTNAFSGRYARGLDNRFMQELRSEADAIPAYPVQNRLTQPLRAAAGRAGDPEALSLWAGQAATLARPGGADELVRRWWAEAQAASQALAARTG